MHRTGIKTTRVWRAAVNDRFRERGEGGGRKVGGGEREKTSLSAHIDLSERARGRVYTEEGTGQADLLNGRVQGGLAGSKGGKLRVD